MPSKLGCLTRKLRKNQRTSAGKEHEVQGSKKKRKFDIASAGGSVNWNLVIRLWVGILLESFWMKGILAAALRLPSSLVRLLLNFSSQQQATLWKAKKWKLHCEGEHVPCMHELLGHSLCRLVHTGSVGYKLPAHIISSPHHHQAVYWSVNLIQMGTDATSVDREMVAQEMAFTMDLVPSREKRFTRSPSPVTAHSAASIPIIVGLQSFFIRREFFFYPINAFSTCSPLLDVKLGFRERN